ncbi:MAG: hypothetical protein KDD04_12445, partial [Sinomicrobium sp.]|nr:hypothetical protein [Sinomicrobium sp.]
MLMNIADYLYRRLTYFKRLKIKKEAIGSVLDHSLLSNDGVINIHRTDPTNAGDFYCGPHHYFDALKNRSLDIFGYKHEDPDVRANWSGQIIRNALI